MTTRALLTRTAHTARGSIRFLSHSTVTRNASQPAPVSSSSSSANPHAARLAAASEDSRSRLAKLQAQRLEELNRGRSSGSSSSGRTNKPEQKWSNRTLIALATSVGACTYLMGTYHGYNAGKAYVLEEQQLTAGSTSAPVTAAPPAASGARVPASTVPTLPASDAASTSTGAISAALLQLLPTRPSLHCEPAPTNPTAPAKCRLAELTQYHCDLQTNRVVCQPIDRIFRL
ncbi:ZIP zinc transporter 1 [Pseudozyma hubeiensis SY62]|uniref:ZIP zinc transporter 1 n=1 Tax=Pseudozyma hubeiensis (strain SY62) TaxID=1305764 RepID=R9PBJ2_PSEHS|nr:ZIP zinc transporter 1 [Pseudozyma hubeiensis SY62]GAC98741.1 ZIP zinc transporter 1 [Pseudozyma hubeiensis SY62]